MDGEMDGAPQDTKESFAVDESNNPKDFIQERIQTWGGGGVDIQEDNSHHCQGRSRMNCRLLIEV